MLPNQAIFLIEQSARTDETKTRSGAFSVLNANLEKKKKKKKRKEKKNHRNRSIRIAQKSIERNLLNTNQIIKVLTEMFSTSCQESCSLCCKVFLEISKTLGLVLAKLDHE